MSLILRLCQPNAVKHDLDGRLRVYLKATVLFADLLLGEKTKS